MPSRREAHEFNASYKPSYTPVAIITGGTHGIGRATALALARHLRGRIHLILVGQNRTAAETLISTLPPASSSPAPTPTADGSTQAHTDEENVNGKYEFVQCDITQMRNIHTMADDFKQRLTKVNFLVHCACETDLRGWTDNGEGLDVKMASRYYSRWALTHDLIPLLKAAEAQDECASVLSVQAAGFGSWIDATDIGLKRTYTPVKAILQSAIYNDYMVKEFSRREPNIAFTHLGPPFVITYRWVHDNPITKILSLPLRPLIWLFTTPVEDSAEYMIYALLASPNGCHLRNGRGDEHAFPESPEYDEIARKVWEHSRDVGIRKFTWQAACLRADEMWLRGVAWSCVEVCSECLRACVIQ